MLQNKVLLLLVVEKKIVYSIFDKIYIFRWIFILTVTRIQVDLSLKAMSDESGIQILSSVSSYLVELVRFLLCLAIWRIFFSNKNSQGNPQALTRILRMVPSLNLSALIMAFDPVGTLGEACNRGSQPRESTPRPLALSSKRARAVG